MTRQRFPRPITFTTLLLAGVAAILVLIDWHRGSPNLVSLGISPVAMHYNTALAVLFCALSSLCHAISSGPSLTRNTRLIDWRSPFTVISTKSSMGRGFLVPPHHCGCQFYNDTQPRTNRGYIPIFARCRAGYTTPPRQLGPYPRDAATRLGPLGNSHRRCFAVGGRGSKRQLWLGKSGANVTKQYSGACAACHSFCCLSPLAKRFCPPQRIAANFRARCLGRLGGSLRVESSPGCW